MLTPREREMLIAARTLIACGEERFICIALINIDERSDTNDGERLRQYISEQLAPWGTLSSWQLHIGFASRDYDPDKWKDQLRQDRIAWIDWMLDESLLPEGCYCY
jgi:hypothetical protein